MIAPIQAATSQPSPAYAIHTRERQFTRIFTTMYGQTHRKRTRLPAKTTAIRMHQAGGPDVLQVEDIRVHDPGAREVRIAQTAVGVNFIDIYQRRGQFPVPALPWVIGFEAAGVVECAGGAVSHVREGDRVAYATAPPGAYTGLRTIDARLVVRVPDTVSDEQAAAVLLKGMTAEYLTHKSYPVQRGDTVLVHAAAGATGQLLCQWLAHLGATVIGTVGDDAKRAVAQANGCRHVINYRDENVAALVDGITSGKRLPVVYDSVGRDTGGASLACLQPGGTLVLYGQSSGPTALPADGKAQSVVVKRPGLFDENDTEETLQARAASVFDLVQRGVLRTDTVQSHPLADAAKVHAAIEARATTGPTILRP